MQITQHLELRGANDLQPHFRRHPPHKQPGKIRSILNEQLLRAGARQRQAPEAPRADVDPREVRIVVDDGQTPKRSAAG